MAPAERRLLAQAWFLLLAVDIGLRLLSFPALRRRLALRTPRPAPPAEQIEPAIRRTASLVDRAARHHLYPMTCLRRSLALQRLRLIRLDPEEAVAPRLPTNVG